MLSSFRELEADLKQFTEDDEPYAAMASWLVKPILKELKDLEHRFEDEFGP